MMENGGTHALHYERLVATGPKATHEVFLSEIWWKGGLPFIISCVLPTRMINPPIDETGTGGVRQLPTWVQEEIVVAELGRFLEYRVKKSWLPLKFHYARVEFKPATEEGGAEQDQEQDPESHKTKVIWNLSYTPSFAMHWFIYPLFVVMINWLFLRRLERSCRHRQQTVKG